MEIEYVVFGSILATLFCYTAVLRVGYTTIKRDNFLLYDCTTYLQT